MGYLYSKFTRYCCSGGGNSSKNQNQAIKNTEGHGLKRIATGSRSEKLGWPSTLLISFWRLHSYFGAQSTKLNLIWQETKKKKKNNSAQYQFFELSDKMSCKFNLPSDLCYLSLLWSPAMKVQPLRRSNVVTKARNKILATKLWHKKCINCTGGDHFKQRLKAVSC